MIDHCGSLASTPQNNSIRGWLDMNRHVARFESVWDMLCGSIILMACSPDRLSNGHFRGDSDTAFVTSHDSGQYLMQTLHHEGARRSL